MIHGLIHQFYANMLAILEHGQYQEILRPPIYKTQKFQDQKRCHAPPRAVKKAGVHSLSCTCQQTPPSSNQVHPRATCIHAPQLYDVIDVVAKPSLTHSSWPEPNRLQKKKKKKKALDHGWLWPKSQNFQNQLVPLSFSSPLQFWNPILHSKLGDCVNV